MWSTIAGETKMFKIIIISFMCVTFAIADDCTDQHDGFVFDDPSACDAFFMCINKEAVSLNCPLGQYFDPIGIYCDDIANVNCDLETEGTPEGTTEGITEGTTEGTTAATPGTPGTPSPTTSVPPTEAPLPEPQPIQCPPNGVHVLPHPHLCNRFIVCVLGDFSEFSCETGEHWSQATEECEQAESVQCTIEAERCPKIDIVGENVLHACVLDCNRFYICFKQRLLEARCPTGFNFDYITKTCLPFSDANCALENPNELIRWT